MAWQAVVLILGFYFGLVQVFCVSMVIANKTEGGDR